MYKSSYDLYGFDADDRRFCVIINQTSVPMQSGIAQLFQSRELELVGVFSEYLY